MTLPATLAHGDYHVLACADDMLTVAESDESNNCGASATTLLVTAPDMVTTAISNPPSSAAPGSTFSVTDTAQNASPVSVGYTTTRYYLSADLVKSSGDILLTSVRSLLPLAAGATSTGSRVITVPATTPDGTYRVLACADDTLGVVEADEANNCAASATTLLVTHPDLVTTSVSNPPGSAAPGATLTVTDTVRNASPVGAGYSTTRYYLSADALKSAGDVLVTAVRTVLPIAAGATSTGSRVMTIPAATPVGTYRVLACADDTLQINESDESNNCLASSTSMVVALPDLVVTGITEPPAAIGASGTFNLTETVQNVGDAGTSSWSTVRYYLSLDRTFDGGDLSLSAFRSISGLAPGATSTGTRSLQMPTASGTYFVIACADAGAAVNEADESNNCLASTTAVTIR